MAGGAVKYRHLSRTSSHRKALLRNLVTALVKEEAIHTTWPKAKEAQRMAEKLITLAKRNNETSRRAAQGILFVSLNLSPYPVLQILSRIIFLIWRTKILYANTSSLEDAA